MQKLKAKKLTSTLYELGKLNIILGEERKGIYYTLKALRYEPLNLRVFRNFLQLFLPRSKKFTTSL